MNTYRRYIANSEVVAYAPQGAQSDHLFVYKSGDPLGEPLAPTLDDLFKRWSGASRQGTRRRTRSVVPRSLYFCQKFDLGTIEKVLESFYKHYDSSRLWGKLAYWREPTFTGVQPDSLFLDGQVAQIDTGNISLMLEGQVPLSLDHFDKIYLDASQATLFLLFTANTKCRIRRRDNSVIASASENQISISLGTRKDFVAGAVAMTTAWPQNRKVDHPLRMVGFVYLTADTPAAGHVAKCDVWRAQLADEVAAVKADACSVALDPRDTPRFARWLNGGANSRMDFGATRLRSSFFGTQAQRIHLRAAEGGTARLGFIYDQLRHDGTMTSRGEVIFHPEGSFNLEDMRDRRSQRAKQATGSQDLIVGAAATEFTDLLGVTQMDFQKGGPAFLKQNEEAIPVEKRTILEDKNGFAVTSFLSFVNGTQGIGAIDYHSQPADAPLFAEVQGDNEHLGRRRVPYGATKTAMPSFPLAGYKDRALDSMLRYEATHLSVWRRLKAKRAIDKADAGPSMGVTPQGLLAEVSLAGYKTLYFGNSDSLDPHPEFSISIREGDTELNREFQQTLSGSQLFLVFDRPDIHTLNTIEVAATVYIREFQFSVHIGPIANVETETSVLIVKYFKDKSLNELLDDTTSWGCSRFLAPSMDRGRVKSLLHEGGDETKPIPPELSAILEDRNWQGVLILHLPILGMPDLLEALRPGMVESKLTVHHFGLNFLPAQKSDLHPAPVRLCSAFGLINYSKPQEDPAPPKPIDQEPLDAGRSSEFGEVDREYRFTVQYLNIGFRNSQISSFNATVDVSFSHLFWDKSSIGGNANRAGGSGVRLIGAYERRVKPDNTTEDVFSLRTDAQYVISFSEDASFLKSLTLKRAQLSIVSAKRNSDKRLETLTAFIGIDGDLEMREDKLKIPLFKVRAIHLTNFGFQFVYSPKPKPTPNEFGFGLKADGIGADVDFDPPSAASSVLGLLPVKLKGMAVAIANLLDLGRLNFQPIGGIGSLFHFGLVLEVDFGSMGSLMGDLRGMRLPMIIGWRGGQTKGLALGIQFPSFAGKLDIGIQQFIRFRAKELNLVPCPDVGERKALAIQTVDAKIIMFGKEWPDAETSFAIFLKTDHPSRKVSWALGVTPSNSALKYLGGGQRLGVAEENVTNTKALVDRFQKALPDAKKICSLIDLARPELDGWTIVAHFTAGVDVWLAVSDAQKVYGLVVALPVLGEIDVLYRRVNDQLGIFSAEYTLPEALRTIQVGAASVRLPTFRLEIHTDGGFLIDVGFPWKNDFSRSCQVEIAIFLGAGGFYFGRTSAAASELLTFKGGYGFEKPDDTELLKYRALRFGFAARVGIGRSFSIGILSASASITVFGGIEGAAGYPDGGGEILSPTLYALRGYVGVMLDIEASVDFFIIRARAKLLAYAMVGLELRRVLAKDKGTHLPVKLPIVIFAEVGITVEVDVEISIGCISVTIHLSFSATLRIEETLGELDPKPKVFDHQKKRLLSGRERSAQGFTWNLSYRYWSKVHDMNLFGTVVPCMASASDVGESGDYKTCAVGQMMLMADAAPGGLSDVVQFLAGWVLKPDTVAGIPADTRITLDEVVKLRSKIQSDEQFWNGFREALEAIVGKQFNPILTGVSKKNSSDAFASIPLWPGTSFRYVPKQRGVIAVVASAQFVTDAGTTLRGDEASFAEYAKCVIMGALAHLQQLIVANGTSRSDDPGRNDPERYLTWADFCRQMLDSKGA